MPLTFWPEPAWVCLVMLVLVMGASCCTNWHPGILAMCLASLLGAYMAFLNQQPLDKAILEVLRSLPADLFITLTVLTFFFAQLSVNGTLEWLVSVAERICHGRPGWTLIAFFLVASGIGVIGAGNIASAALIAPLALRAAERSRIPPLLMFITVAHGAMSSALSPVTPTGVTTASLLRDKLLIEGLQWRLFANNFVANMGVALLGFVLFGGRKLWRGTIPGARSQASLERDHPGAQDLAIDLPVNSWRATHLVSLLILTAMLVAILWFGVPVALTALIGAAVISIAALSNDEEALRAVPWSVIIMVCGITVLTAQMEKSGSSDKVALWISQHVPAAILPGLLAMVAGLVSVYSSTLGVVLPTFLPLVHRLVVQIPGSNPVTLASAVIIGGHLVDASPLSTIGALCLAATPASIDRRRLFNATLVWGLSMALVGVILCQLLALF